MKQNKKEIKKINRQIKTLKKIKKRKSIEGLKPISDKEARDLDIKEDKIINIIFI